MKLMTLKQYSKMSKPALIRKITKALRAMPKAKLARLCYTLTKAKLPRLRKRKITGGFPSGAPVYYGKSGIPRRSQYYSARSIEYRAKPKRKTKRKFSPKQLAAQRLFAKRARAGTLRKRRR
jgi:hypothetical protein|tara:strand:+ start:62 stop:427 length:366 start_codon:yes stop_codon:yes gene_type:complete